VVFSVPRSDVLIKLLGPPYAADMVTSALRLSGALLDRGASVQVWTCGYATSLTTAGLGDAKPRNVLDWSRVFPSTSTLVAELLAAHSGRLHWFVCRACATERGTADQMATVRLRSPSRFWEHVQATDQLLAMGAGAG
jgi:sulfur relay (sulfurtransferase) complex TusBCD TusD component (DsrE family)